MRHLITLVKDLRNLVYYTTQVPRLHPQFAPLTGFWDFPCKFKIIIPTYMLDYITKSWSLHLHQHLATRSRRLSVLLNFCYFTAGVRFTRPKCLFSLAYSLVRACRASIRTSNNYGTLSHPQKVVILHVSKRVRESQCTTRIVSIRSGVRLAPTTAPSRFPTSSALDRTPGERPSAWTSFYNGPHDWLAVYNSAGNMWLLAIEPGRYLASHNSTAEAIASIATQTGIKIGCSLFLTWNSN